MRVQAAGSSPTDAECDAVTPTFVYAATVERLVDADTVDVDLDLGMRVHMKTRLRVAHVDAPERYTTEGRDAIMFATGQKPDKYGRALADIVLPDGQDYARLLVDAGHAVPYEGGPR